MVIIHIKDEEVLLGTNANFISGSRYRNVACKLYEIIILLYIAVVNYQLEYCVKGFTFQDGYNCSENNSKRTRIVEKKTGKVEGICVKET